MSIRRLTEIRRSDYHHRPNNERGGDLEVEQNDTSNKGEDDGERSSESLHDIVRILDDERRDQSSDDLREDDGPSPEAEVGEDSLRRDGCDRIRIGAEGVEIRDEDGEEGGKEGKEGELDVSDP